MNELLDQTKFFDTVNYENNKGSKTGILLIHGFTNTTYELKKLIDFLTIQNYHVIADNLPSAPLVRIIRYGDLDSGVLAVEGNKATRTPTICEGRIKGINRAFYRARIAAVFVNALATIQRPGLSRAFTITFEIIL